MTYPGLPGQVGPPPSSINTVASQVRQSKAGQPPGTAGSIRFAGAVPYQSVWWSQGDYAPLTGRAAELVTVMDEYAADPHPLAKQNFQLDFDQYNNPPGTGEADPGYGGM